MYRMDLTFNLHQIKKKIVNVYNSVKFIVNVYGKIEFAIKVNRFNYFAYFSDIDHLISG